MKPHWIDKFIPPMECEKGCGECCGVALAPEAEYQRVVAYAKEHGIEPLRQGVTCPFYQDGGCAVYEARPSVCRLFGHSPRLVCTRGHNTNIHPQSELKIFERMQTEMLEKGLRILHEAVYTIEEFTSVVRYKLAQAVPLTIGGKLVGHKPDNKTYHAAMALQDGLGIRMGKSFVDEGSMPL